MQRQMPRWFGFARQVLTDFFQHNHGLLLTGAVAHSILLSLIPLCAVLMVVFSHFFEERLLMTTLTGEIDLIAPGFAPILTDVLEGFLRSRQVVGGVGLLGLLFFSTVAFRVISDAIAIIFRRSAPTHKRKFWVSALIPYLFVLIVAGGLIFITLANALIDVSGALGESIPQLKTLIDLHVGKLLYVIGVLGLVLLFTLFYKIMPVTKVSFRRALAGGLTAAILWEITRHVLVSYYTHVSMVNVLYGSMATIVIVLLTLEAAAMILLLGAQVIADLQHKADTGQPWHGVHKEDK